ncbi:alpha-amylase family protein [Bacteroidota bacterium]
MLKRTTGIVLLCILVVGLHQCRRQENNMKNEASKIVIYQLLPRLFGNQVSTNKPWGTIEDNGVGKFIDISDKALDEIRELGVTHIWYTGVLHHCVIRDYTAYGISPDDPDVVKGRAGSPYAIRDYYNVNPDLAVDPAKRLEEFEALIERTHAHGLKVIIDIVPNHVARNYHSISKPEGIKDFGEDDDTSVAYHRDNNFYYIPGEAFQVPDFKEGFMPLGGQDHPLRDGKFGEIPAKWTGNGARQAKPNLHDWYETVKVNFGVTPEGVKEFDELPEDYRVKAYDAHYEFWKERKVPDTWVKFRHIASYWLDKGVDGFRFDMAQMVPVEFWSYLNASIKMENAEAILISEIYVPEIYRDYIQLGKMDYMYDKVELYDTLKHIIQGHGSTDNLPQIIDSQADIEHHMLHFLENHDEHRLPAPEFAGDARKGFPAMVVSSTLGTSPTMLYFGQEVGEKGEGDAGFGKTGRTTIFDYWGVPAHQRWMNEGAFDGDKLREEEKEIRTFYKTLLNQVKEQDVFMGGYIALHAYNRTHTEGYTDKLFSFIRYKGDERRIILVNFMDKSSQFELKLPHEAIEALELRMGSYTLKDQLGGSKQFKLSVRGNEASGLITIDPLESLILAF